MPTTILQGRLGNQLFQYAFARAQHFESGQTSVLSEFSLIQNKIHNRLDCFDIPSDVVFVKNHELTLVQKVAISLNVRLNAKKDRITRHRLEISNRELYLKFGLFLCEDGYITPPSKSELKSSTLNIGYFQSEKYFLKFKRQILKELEFKSSIKESCADIAKQISQSKDSTCLHVRLGDYVRNPLHGVADANYYINAIKGLRAIIPHATIFLFSDNVELAKSELHLDDSVICIPSTLDEQQSMYLGSLCKNFIISNSSYSWWMQYLSDNPNRVVFAPSKWYAKPCQCDIYQDFWHLIEV